MTMAEVHARQEKSAPSAEMRIKKAKAAILAKIAEDIKASAPLKKTGTVVDEGGELILYSVDFRGLITEGGGGLLPHIFCQCVSGTDREKALLYAAHKAKDVAVLGEDEKKLIYQNILRAGFCGDR